jgi:hypothetical protein
MFRVEPTSGISDPALPGEQGVTLVQNDDDFNSMLVNLGAFGVVYTYILKTTELYWLRESKRLHHWSEIRSRLKSGELFRYKDSNGNIREYRSVMVQVNPYRNEEIKDHLCIVVKHRLAEPESRTILEMTRSIFTWLGNNPLVFWFTRNRLRNSPEKAPKMIDTSLKALKDKVYINKSYKVLFQGVEYIKERAFDTEFAFDMARPYWDVVDELFRKAEQFKNQGWYATAPIGLRFVKRSGAYITPEYNREVCYIDTSFLIGTRGAYEMVTGFQELMFSEGGIPHWGKKNAELSNHLDILDRYLPKLAVWKHLRHKYDPLRTFSNEYLEKFSLT